MLAIRDFGNVYLGKEREFLKDLLLRERFKANSGKTSRKRDLILYLKKEKIATFEIKGYRMFLVTIGATLHFSEDLTTFR